MGSTGTICNFKTVKEVEIKIRIDDADATVEALEKQGCVFSQAVEQRDIVYIANDQPAVPVPAGANVLRIRLEKDRKVFTLKRSDFGNNLSKIEHEVEIKDGERMAEIVKLLGYKIVADTTKTRRRCKIENFEICVDRVNELGDYLEMEEMTDRDPKQAQQEMLEFLKQLGIDSSRQEEFGYDVLYVRKHGNYGV